MLLFLLPSLAIIWNIDKQSRRILLESLHSDLSSSALVMATTVDPVVHATFHDRAQEKGDSYQQQIARFSKMRPAVDPNGVIKFVYTCIQKDGAIYFILDDTPEGDADHDGVDDKAHIMEPYKDASDALKAVFVERRAKVNEAPYTDKWGTFLSGYAPVFDAQHNVAAVVGVDIALSDYELELSSLRMVATLSILGAFCIALMAGLLMAKYHHRLTQSFSRLVTLNEAATAASKAKSDILATMSHELRTPLNAIVGHASLLVSAVPPEQKGSVVEIQRASDSLLGMITDILDYAAMDATKLPVSLKPVQIPNLLHELCTRFTADAQAKGLKLEIVTHPSLATRLMIDPGHVSQILRHLITNAIKFTATGSVKMEAKEWKDRKLHFIVKDTGVGISPGKQKRLFEVFDQEDMSTTRQHGGAGLGLAICKRMCDAMHGRIWLETTSSEGSEFHVELPAEAAPEPSHVWLVTKNNMTTIIVRSLVEKTGRSFHVLEDVLDVRAADHDLVLVDIGSVSADGVEAKHTVALNAEGDVAPGTFAEVLNVPLKPADLRRVLEKYC